MTTNEFSRTFAPSMSMVYTFFLQTYLTPIHPLNSRLPPTRSRAKSPVLSSKDYTPQVPPLSPFNRLLPPIPLLLGIRALARMLCALLISAQPSGRLISTTLTPWPSSSIWMQSQVSILMTLAGIREPTQPVPSRPLPDAHVL